MSTLKWRELNCQIDTIKIVVKAEEKSSPLRVTFKAKKNLTKIPNECEVKIYNLSPEHRQALTQKKAPVVSLVAGYRDETTHIFLGEAIHVEHEKTDKGDVVTTVSTTDGGAKKQTARVNVSFGPRAAITDVLRTLAKELGVKPGNLEEVSARLAKSVKGNVYLEGVTMSGSAGNEFDNLIKSAGLEWSIQNGALQLLDVGKASAGFAILLHEGVLIGSPSISNKGVLRATTFLQKDIVPGRLVVVDHEFVKGQYRLEQCEYEGDTRAEDWFVKFEAKSAQKKAST